MIICRMFLNIKDTLIMRRKSAKDFQRGACDFSQTIIKISSIQLLSHVQLFETLWTTAFQASLSMTNSQSLPRLISIESVMPSKHHILCRPLLLPPSIFLSIFFIYSSQQSYFPQECSSNFHFEFLTLGKIVSGRQHIYPHFTFEGAEIQRG